MDKPIGRYRQKQRTRNAIVAAARDLVEQGRLPSIAEVADAALVSPATAYRYFPDQLSLLREALRDAMPRLDGLSAPALDQATDPVERAGQAAETFLRLTLRRAALVRAVMALSLLRSIEAGAARHEAATLRPGYRHAWIEAVLRPLEGTVAPPELERLRLALVVVMGSEALVALQDVAGQDADTAVEVCAWAARTLVRAVVGDQDAASSR